MKKQKAYLVTIAVLIIGAVLLSVLLRRNNDTENVSGAASTTSSIVEDQNGVSKEHQGKINLFILAGQSNMSGKGSIPESAKETNPNIYVFGNDYHWNLAVEPVDSPIGQVDKVSEDEGVGFSPSVAFATAVLEKYPDMVIGLIPCARSGTSLQEWQRNLSDDSLYGSCLKRAHAASTMGEISGLLFFQGEQDAVAPNLRTDQSLPPERWGSEFALFVESWRSDLNQPALPIVFAQIGTTTIPEFATNWDVIQAQQRAVQLPFCKMITTDDLALKDGVHFTTESYKIIGQRFAKAYLELIEGQ